MFSEALLEQMARRVQVTSVNNRGGVFGLEVLREREHPYVQDGARRICDAAASGPSSE